MTVSVCLSVCLSVCDHVFRTARPIFTKFFRHVAYGHDLVFLWWRIDTLRFSGFMDVIFAQLRLLYITARLRQ